MNNDDARVLEASRNYLAAEKAFQQAKQELTEACDEHGKGSVYDSYLPNYILDNGRLYHLQYERSKTPTIREIGHHVILVVPTAG